MRMPPLPSQEDFLPLATPQQEAVRGMTAAFTGVARAISDFDRTFRLFIGQVYAAAGKPYGNSEDAMMRWWNEQQL